jgi:hypothetical protein
VHRIEVHTLSTPGEILNNREATAKITKWAIELSMYDIIYKTRMAIKAQALSNFMVEWTEIQTPPKKKNSSIVPSTSTGPYNFKVQEQVFW